MAVGYSYWNTFQEKKFIDLIGTHREYNPRPFAVRELLRLYLIACHRRRRWGNLNKKEVLDHVRRRISEIEEAEGEERK